MRVDKACAVKKIVGAGSVLNAERFRPVVGFSIDSRTIKKGEAFIAVKGARYDGHDHIAQALARGAACVIAQRARADLPGAVFLVKDSLAAMAAAAAYMRRISRAKVVAITGSVGKTTTKEMLYHILKAGRRVLKNDKTENNLFGVAKTLFRLRKQKILIIELGTNAPGEIRELTRIVRPDIAVITFIKPAHLEGLKSLKGILKEKTDIFRSVPGVKAVLNADDEYLKGVNYGKIFWYGIEKRRGLWAEPVKKDRAGTRFMVKGKYPLRIRGSFDGFIYNALAAVQAAVLVKAALPAAVRRMNVFKALPDLRMQRARLGRITVINDAYNANPFAVSAALAALGSDRREKIAVLGDMLELGGRSRLYHRALADNVIASGCAYCLTYGDKMRDLNKRLLALGFKGARHFLRHKDIARFIKKIAAQKSSNVGAVRELPLLVLLKGSRRMRLEEVLGYLEK